MFQIPVVVLDDPLMWLVFIVLSAIALAVSKLIRTLGNIVCIEIWARFMRRHRHAKGKVRKLIERSSRNDLRAYRLLLRQHRE